MRADPWQCPPLNLLNWNMAWMWKAPAQGFANTHPTTMFALGVVGQSRKSRIGLVYQVAKNNR
jgi:hypothetical protein